MSTMSFTAAQAADLTDAARRRAQSRPESWFASWKRRRAARKKARMLARLERNLPREVEHCLLLISIEASMGYTWRRMYIHGDPYRYRHILCMHTARELRKLGYGVAIGPFDWEYGADKTQPYLSVSWPAEPPLP